MKEQEFMRSTAGSSLLDHRTKGDILEELKVGTVQKKIAQYKRKWLNHVSRMEEIRHPNNSLTMDLLEEDLEDR
jgi:hypothetical protein